MTQATKSNPCSNAQGPKEVTLKVGEEIRIVKCPGNEPLMTIKIDPSVIKEPPPNGPGGSSASPKDK